MSELRLGDHVSTADHYHVNLAFHQAVIRPGDGVVAGRAGIQRYHRRPFKAEIAGKDVGDGVGRIDGGHRFVKAVVFFRDV